MTTGAQGGTFHYDARGNLDREAALPSMATPATYGYDAENRMVSYCSQGGLPCRTDSSATAVYQYDAAGLRVAKGTTTYVYDTQGQLAAEYGGSAVAAGTQYLSTDPLGSVRLMSNGSGTAIASTDYYPYGGEIMATSGNGRSGVGAYGVDLGESLRFTGKERDAETGLDYFGARYFSAAQGRFTSPDWSATPQPIPYADLTDPQTLNLYTYVRNNPLSRTDPDGHCDGVADCLWTGARWVGSGISVGAAAVETATVAAAGAIGGAMVYLASPEVPGAIPSPNPGHQFAMSQDAVSNGTANTYARDANENYVPSGKQGQAQQGQQSTPGDPNDKKGPKAAEAPGTSASGQATDQYGNKLGPSGKPMIHETNSNTREGARNRALNEGSGATEHSNPTRGNPHFHPTDAQGEKKPNSTHHNYPDNR
jgi:RHS repeat-associated protein